MRSGSVGLVEVSGLRRAKSETPAQPPSSFGIFSSMRESMAPWRFSLFKSATTVQYVAVPEDPEDIEGGTDYDNVRTPRPRPRTPWTWRSCTLGLLLLAVLLLAANLIATLSQPGPRHHKDNDVDSDDDPFSAWGKPGTGTEDLAWYPTDFLRDVVPVACHSHNDYWRRVPLFSALYAGCTGVEADVWLRPGGELLVGHDRASLQPHRTFRTLYVDPLVEILTRQNPATATTHGGELDSNGTAPANGVFDVDPSQTLVLLVDLKTRGAETWPWVLRQLEPLRARGWLSYWENGVFHERPITVVGTGNTPFDQVVSGNHTGFRDAFFDAPLDKLEGSPYDATNSYYASVNFFRAIGTVWWRRGELSKGQLEKIRAHLREAHGRGLKARYWGLPSWPIHVRNRLWEVLVEEGVDMLNVDDLESATRRDWTKPGAF